MENNKRVEEKGQKKVIEDLVTAVDDLYDKFDVLETQLNYLKMKYAKRGNPRETVEPLDKEKGFFIEGTGKIHFQDN